MKAVISSGNKQFIVKKDDVIDIDLVDSDKKTLSFDPLLIIADKEVKVGTPSVGGHSVTAEIIGEVKADKVVAIRFKAKKRVKKVQGHRQRYTQIKITSVK